MPNGIKYSVSQQTNSLKKSNYWVAVGDVDKGPTSSTGYYSAVTPPSGGYTIYLNKANNGPSIYTVANNSQLITFTNNLAGTSYTTAYDCLNWFTTQSDKMVVNMNYGSIITTGLQMGFDADYSISYSQDGTWTWYNMIDYTSYTNADAGNQSWANNVSEITICILLEKVGTGTGYANHPINKWNSGYNVNASFILYHFENYENNGQDGLLGWYGNTVGNGWTNIVGGFPTMVSGEIAQIVLQFNVANGGGQMWKNGVKIGGRAGTTGNLGAPTNPYSTMGISGPLQSSTSKVHQVLFYNRELTDAEIIQNYNAISSRIVTP